MSSNPSLRDSFILSYLEALDCPRALTCLLLYRHGEHSQLAKLEWNPTDYNNLVDARDSLAATSFLSKAKFLATGIDLKKVAIDKFHEAELQCRKSNTRLRCGISATFDELISLAKWKISTVLGTVSSATELFFECADWGPGATTSTRRSNATQPNKYVSERHATFDLINLIGRAADKAYPNWVPFSRSQIHPGCKVITVPKNAKTDRVIAIEPGLNLWFQKAAGTVIRKRLKRHGIDLNTQVRNQELARVAVAKNLATIDFSSASDTISQGIVERLLPRDWYVLLDALRSKRASTDGVYCWLHKFSSMGNGFTFELESLIFYSLAWACCVKNKIDTSDVSIFGDDLILPSGAYPAFLEFATYCGFTTNAKKSYSSGYYRESCGSHFWNGMDIKPLYLKEDLDGQEATLRCINSIRRQARRRNNYCGCDARLLSTWHTLAEFLGSKTPRIPDGYGDVGIIENLDHPDVRCKRANHQLEGWKVRVWLTRPVMKSYHHQGLLLFHLKQCGRGTDISYGNEVPVPGRVQLIRKNMLFPRWTDLGPWV